jgi:hypothetical protein
MTLDRSRKSYARVPLLIIKMFPNHPFNDLPPQTDAESYPAEPDSAATLTASLQSDLGASVTSLTWAVEKPAGVQVRPQTRSQVPKCKDKGGGDLKDDKDAVVAQKSGQTVDPRGQLIEVKIGSIYTSHQQI